MLALKPMAIPRPRRLVSVPRSNGRSHCMRVARRSSTKSSAASRISVPVACGRPSRSRFLRRISSGSIFNSRAIMSVWLSYAHTNCGMPKPRNAPAAGRLVYSAYESICTLSISYGPAAVKPDFCVTRGPMSAYAPPFHHTSHSRAVIRPSFVTPLLIRKVVACLVIM